MRLTLGLIKSKLDEHGLGNDVQLVEVSPDGGRVDVGPFQAEFVRMTHSIPDAVAVALHTAHGTILHTGDFKIDMTPIDGRPADLARLRQLGDRGVALLLSDSTNAENPGRTASEATVGPSLRKIIAEAPGRVIVTSFASTPVGVSIMRPTVRTSNAELTSSAQAIATSAATSTE